MKKLLLAMAVAMAASFGMRADTITNDNWVSMGVPDVEGTVQAIASDGKGNLYVAGLFTTAGGVACKNIAKWDGTAWSALGEGISIYEVSSYVYRLGVSALVCDSSGNLYAGGYFGAAGGVSCYSIAKWNGATWEALGTGMVNSSEQAYVFSLAIDSADNLYAGGLFTTAGGVACKNIAKWDGTAWTPVGEGTSGYVLALVFDAGSLYAGGCFDTAGETTCNSVAKWDGTTWSAFDAGMLTARGHAGDVCAISLDDLGNLYAGGYFASAGGQACKNLAKWDGSSWAAIEYQGASIFGLACDKSNNLFATGWVVQTGGSGYTAGVVQWDGVAWHTYEYLGGEALAFGDDDCLYAGGHGNMVCKWDGTEWLSLGKALNGGVNALACAHNEGVYVGGDFTFAGGLPANNGAKWNGSTWSALGQGVNNSIYSMACDASGNLYAGGCFTRTGTDTCNYIAKWDGASWLALGNGMDGEVYSLASDTAGNIYAGGCFPTAGWLINANGIAKWDGEKWGTLGGGLLNADSGVGEVHALAFDILGNLYAGGFFADAGTVACNNIAKWDGTSWSPLGDGTDGYVRALAFDSVGNLYAGGDFLTAGGVSCLGVAKWDGNSWSSLGWFFGSDGISAGYVSALAIDGSDNLYVGGCFAMVNQSLANNIAKWDGKSWSPLGDGMDAEIYALTFDRAGDLYAGGSFTTAGDKVSAYIAKCKIGSVATYHTVTFTAAVNGSIVGDTEQTVVDGGCCSAVTAVADGGYRFAGWTGGLTSTDNPLTVARVTSDMAVTASFESGQAARTISHLAVKLVVIPPSGTTAWGCEENIPAGLEPDSIVGENGVWDVNTRKITWWGSDSSQKELSYVVTGTEGADYTLSGSFTFDGGTAVATSGDNFVSVGYCHPADLNRSFDLVMAEALAYVAGWQTDTNPMDYAIRGVYLWQNGEDYLYDATKARPVCWIPCAKTATATALPAGGGTSVRAVAGDKVTLTVTPPSGAVVWGCEEYLPDGLTPSDISSPNGKWDASNRKISWWGAGAAQAVLAYTVSGASGVFTPKGKACFDGASVVTGDAATEYHVAPGSVFAYAATTAYTKKPTVSINNGSAAKVLSKASAFKAGVTQLECQWTSTKDVPGTYTLSVGGTVVTDSFIVERPTLVSLSSYTGKTGDQITVVGAFFGSKAPKVFMNYTDAKSGKQKTTPCKIAKPTFADANGKANRSYMDVETGASTLAFTVPKGITADTAAELILMFNFVAVGAEFNQ